MAVPPRKAVGVRRSSSENASAQGEKTEPGSFGEIIGQAEVVRRLTALVELARRSHEPLGHILLLGPHGCGKRTMARVIARELGVSLGTVDSSRIDKAIDFVAIINDLEEGDILHLPNVNRTRQPLIDVIYPAMKDFEVQITLGKGPTARLMRLAVKRFTCIATAQKEADCPPDLVSLFDVVVRLQAYSQAEMLQITDRLATRVGISIDPAASALVARLADGNPGRAESLVRRLRLVEKQPVSEWDAQEMLSVFGYGGGTSAPNLSGAPTDWASLSGIEFERLIAALLNSMGLAAEMTKATGDGGVDIEAILDRPIVGGRYLFQCKRFAPNTLVGSPTVREFYGALVADRKALKGILKRHRALPRRRESSQRTCP